MHAYNDGRKILRLDTVEIYFSDSNHYTSTGIVVRTTKINFNRYIPIMLPWLS